MKEEARSASEWSEQTSEQTTATAVATSERKRREERGAGQTGAGFRPRISSVTTTLPRVSPRSHVTYRQSCLRPRTQTASTLDRMYTLIRQLASTGLRCHERRGRKICPLLTPCSRCCCCCCSMRECKGREGKKQRLGRVSSVHLWHKAGRCFMSFWWTTGRRPILTRSLSGCLDMLRLCCGSYCLMRRALPPFAQSIHPLALLASARSTAGSSGSGVRRLQVIEIFLLKCTSRAVHVASEREGARLYL